MKLTTVTVLALGVAIAGCSRAREGQASAETVQAAAPAPGADPVKRGEYLVNAIGCHDCHTPKRMTANGPELIRERLLSGHPADEALPAPPAPGGPWIVSGSGDTTAWAGPWGTSYAANLTPDPDTGLGNWTEQMFVNALRTGKHMGSSRPILPPMPWQAYGTMNDEDLKAMFAYLRSIPPLQNRVPDPVFASQP
jgi:mono/diheme cytochrome c family protein